jgi:hypothetical protein
MVEQLKVRVHREGVVAGRGRPDKSLELRQDDVTLWTLSAEAVRAG